MDFESRGKLVLGVRLQKNGLWNKQSSSSSSSSAPPPRAGGLPTSWGGGVFNLKERPGLGTGRGPQSLGPLSAPGPRPVIPAGGGPTIVNGMLKISAGPLRTEPWPGGWLAGKGISIEPTRTGGDQGKGRRAGSEVAAMLRSITHPPSLPSGGEVGVLPALRKGADPDAVAGLALQGGGHAPLAERRWPAPGPFPAGRALAKKYWLEGSQTQYRNTIAMRYAIKTKKVRKFDLF